MQEEARKLIHSRNFGFLATLNSDGSPQVTPVWVDEKDGHLLVNTAVGRRKERNTRKDPRVALAIPDWEDPYTYIEVRGRVVDWITGPEAEEHIDKLAIKYTGEKFKWRQPGSRRIILKIKPEKVILG